MRRIRFIFIGVGVLAAVLVFVTLWGQQVTEEPRVFPSDLCQRIAPKTSGPNFFVNPSFEEGENPWFVLKETGFVTTNEVSHSGNSSALLRMDEPAAANGTKIWYLIQEVKPSELPEIISGYYLVRNWEKNTASQYVQLAVVVSHADNFPRIFPNYQIRYILNGLTEPPFNVPNAKFIFLGPENPTVGEWVSFERNLRADFEEVWGIVPSDYDCLRFLFGVRYDDKVSGDGPAKADVYFDDLYLGSAEGKDD